MSTVISKASIHLSVNSGGVDVGLKKASDGIKDFSGRARKDMDSIKGATTSYAAESGQRLKGVGEQLGKVAAATGSLASLDLSRPQTVFAALQNSIAGVGSALEAGANKAAIFRGALAATGIGLLVAGASALFDLFRGPGDRDMTTGEGFSAAIAEESARRRGGDRTFMDPIVRAASGGPTLASETAAARPAADLATEAWRARTDLASASAGMGMTADAARLEEMRTRLRGMATDTDAARLAFRAASHEIAAFADSIERAEARRTATGLEALGDSFRHASATMGMSTEQAAIYRASLVRVTETIDGVTRTVERAMGPQELLARRTADLEAAFRAGRINADQFRTGMAEAREEARRHGAALEGVRRDARNMGMDQARDQARGLARSLEEAARFAGMPDAQRQLAQLEESLRRAGVPAGELRTLMQINTLAAEREAAATDRVRLRDADVSPLTRAREELRRINELRRRGDIDEGLRARSVGRLLSGLAGSGMAAELRGPQLLEAGSVDAERVLRDFRRGGDSDPQEQLLRRVEESLVEERRQREAMERLARRFDEIGVAGL